MNRKVASIAAEGRQAAEKWMRASRRAFCISRRLIVDPTGYVGLVSRASRKKPAPAIGCGGTTSSAASPLLSDAPRHRRRRGFLHPTPWRSRLDHRRQTPDSREIRHRPAITRLTPFFSNLLN